MIDNPYPVYILSEPMIQQYKQFVICVWSESYELFYWKVTSPTKNWSSKIKDHQTSYKTMQSAQLAAQQYIESVS